MSKGIGGIAHDAVGSLATHKPSKNFGNLFEEKKAQLESLQAALTRAVLPKTPPMPAVNEGLLWISDSLLIYLLIQKLYSMIRKVE